MFAPKDLGPTVRISAFTLTGLSTLVVAVRFYCRICVVGKLKLYDYTMSLAVLCTWGLCVVNHYQLLYGSGQHPRPLYLKADPPWHTRELLLGSARSWYAYQIMYIADLAIIKFSILFFYLSIATERAFRWLVFACMAAVGVFTVAMIFVNAFECPRKLNAALSPAVFGDRSRYRCIDLSTLYFSQAGFNIASDLFIWIMPIPVLAKLRMDKLKRWALLGLFAVGIIAPVASGLRLWSVYLWSKANARSRYNGGYILFWTQVELNTAIVCASAPSLQPLIKHLFGGLTRAHQRNSWYYYGGGTLPNASEIEAGRGSVHADLQTPRASYPAARKVSSSEFDNDKVLVRDFNDAEEEIRVRVLHFSSNRSSAYSSQPPKSPQRPRDMLLAG
ncbi:hypothetical protein BDV96DRAFT_650444 [Lophiotrema nucula]|uniref:Rhodopsin domain-containing protein n=1 Tax=Lophiotrema nucula TaxID=690887 RepID=A0A6A5YXJ7_9PLEO|nr:hypothetical protein BDV96DRAFT_650444 [Lophiotrema nucula]